MKIEITGEMVEELNNLAKEFCGKLNGIGVPCFDAGHVSVSAAKMRSNSCLADCGISGGTAFIRINEHYVLEKNGRRMLEETMCHELAHTCPGAFGHNEEFAKYADVIKKNLGYNILDFPDGFEYAHLPVVFRVSCECGVTKTFRNPKALKTKTVMNMLDGKHYRCLECGRRVSYTVGTPD